MNNSFDRLVDGMCATLRSEVLTRLDDPFARGQVFGVINLLNTFKVRADWSAGFLLQQIAAQRAGLAQAAALCDGDSATEGPNVAPPSSTPAEAEGEQGPASIDDLLARRDALNRSIGAWLAWLDVARARLAADTAHGIEQALRTAMRAEVDLELRNAPRPLFAEMSSGRED